MSYSSRHRYKSRREKNQENWSKFKMAILVSLIALLVYVIKNWVPLRDHVMTYFY